MDEKTYLWWTRVPTALQSVLKATSSISKWRSVCICDDYSSQNQGFFESVTNTISSENYDIGIYDLQVNQLSENNSIIDSIADYLQIGYMGQRNIMSLKPELPPNGSLWTLGSLPKSRLKEMELLLKQIRDAHISLSFLFSCSAESRLKGCDYIDIRPSKLDLQYYAWTLMMGRYPSYLLDYASQLAVEMSYGEPDRCADICASFIKEPKGIHNLTLRFSESDSISCIHTAQVRVIEPMIEYGRRNLISKLEKRLMLLLPFTDEYGTQFTQPIDVELRNLVYYRNKLSLSNSEKKLLDTLYTARNKISHLELLSLDDIQKLSELEL